MARLKNKDFLGKSRRTPVSSPQHGVDSIGQQRVFLDFIYAALLYFLNND